MQFFHYPQNAGVSPGYLKHTELFTGISIQGYINNSYCALRNKQKNSSKLNPIIPPLPCQLTPGTPPLPFQGWTLWPKYVSLSTFILPSAQDAESDFLK